MDGHVSNKFSEKLRWNVARVNNLLLDAIPEGCNAELHRLVIEVARLTCTPHAKTREYILMAPDFRWNPEDGRMYRTTHKETLDGRVLLTAAHAEKAGSAASEEMLRLESAEVERVFKARRALDEPAAGEHTAGG